MALRRFDSYGRRSQQQKGNSMNDIHTAPGMFGIIYVGHNGQTAEESIKGRDDRRERLAQRYGW